eukprot:GFYU01009159.1.p1 GENE.GFYU01009159.1~~GFYU01009159.1.p1  ORF type:complete len:265 (+),score=74.58 GFYU01009159.1:96-890(+)
MHIQHHSEDTAHKVSTVADGKDMDPLSWQVLGSTAVACTSAHGDKCRSRRSRSLSSLESHPSKALDLEENMTQASRQSAPTIETRRLSLVREPKVYTTTPHTNDVEVKSAPTTFPNVTSKTTPTLPRPTPAVTNDHLTVRLQQAVHSRVHEVSKELARGLKSKLKTELTAFARDVEGCVVEEAMPVLQCVVGLTKATGLDKSTPGEELIAFAINSCFDEYKQSLVRYTRELNKLQQLTAVERSSSTRASLVDSVSFEIDSELMH